MPWTSRDPVKSRREYKGELFLRMSLGHLKERNVLESFNQFFEEMVLNSLYEGTVPLS